MALSAAAIPAWPMRYGRRTVNLAIPEGNVRGLHRPRGATCGRSAEGALRDAVASADPPLRDAVCGRRVSLLLSDATREEPRAAAAAALASDLSAAREVRLVIATGSHDPRSADNAALASTAGAMYRDAGVPVSGCLVHDAAAGPFDDLGTTSRGTPVRLNAAAIDADLFVVVSDMKPHYFAGYSCPPKFVFPGLAAMEAIEANHAYTLDDASRTGRHPWHPDPLRRRNTLAEDYVEAFEIAMAGRPAFALAFGSSAEEIAWAEAGELRSAASRGMAQVDAACGVAVSPSRHVIVSPGGHPNDVDLYIAQRALELTSAAMRDGADVLFLCECPGGIGPAHSLAAFWEPLKGDLAALAASEPRPYRLYSHKAVRFARLIRRLRRLHLHSILPDEEVAAAHMSPVRDPQEVVGSWLAEEPEASILLFDLANKLSVTAA